MSKRQRSAKPWRMLEFFTDPEPQPWASQTMKNPVLPPGWTRCATPNCSSNPHDYFQWSSSNLCVNLAACPPSQVMTSIGPTADVAANYFVHATRRLITWGWHRSGAIGTGFARYTLVEQWLRPAGDVGVDPFIRALPVPLSSLPSTRVQPEPMEAPDAQAEAWPEAPRYPWAPYSQPATQHEFGPEEPPPPKKVVHKDRPDRAIKIRRVPKTVLGLLGAFHATTEFADLVDALSDALGDRCKGASGLVGKTACVIENWDEFLKPEVMAAALWNAAANQIEDAVMGRILGARFPGIRPYTMGYSTDKAIEFSGMVPGAGKMPQIPRMSGL